MRGFLSLQGPSSFLSLHEFSVEFREEKERQLAEFRSKAAKESDDIFKEKSENLPKFLYKSYAIAGAGFVILTLAIAFSPWIKDRLDLDIDKKISSIASSEIGKRLQPISTLDQTTAKILEKRLDDIDERIKKMSSKESLEDESAKE